MNRTGTSVASAGSVTMKNAFLFIFKRESEDSLRFCNEYWQIIHKFIATY